MIWIHECIEEYPDLEEIHIEDILAIITPDKISDRKEKQMRALFHNTAKAREASHVTQYLIKHEPRNQKEIALHVGVNQPKMTQLLNEMERLKIKLIKRVIYKSLYR